MAWQIRYKDKALNELLGVQEPQRRRIADKISALKENPFPPGYKKLQGPDEFYRI
jgi:mRNA-degrading endonuclease RelE of RelBE toxin-antitoxin system